MQVEKCAIFWEISHLHWRNFSIVCIILSSAHTKSFIYFSLSVPVVLNIGELIIIKRTKQMGVNRLNSVQKATNLKKKSKVGINEMFSNC